MKASNNTIVNARFRFRLPDGTTLTDGRTRRVALSSIEYAARLFRKHGITLLPLGVVAGA